MPYDSHSNTINSKRHPIHSLYTPENKYIIHFPLEPFKGIGMNYTAISIDIDAIVIIGRVLHFHASNTPFY